MTVIAWDGKSLAADRQCQAQGVQRPVTKLHKVRTVTAEEWVVAFCGSLAQGLVLMEWFKEGADPGKWPAFQRTDDWSTLVVANRSSCFMYEQEPVRIHLPGPFMAFGGGKEFALGAMSAGANAKRAVEIACEHCIYCGLGVDVVKLP